MYILQNELVTQEIEIYGQCHLLNTLAVRVCFILKFSISHYEFLHTQSVFINFNEPLVHRNIVVCVFCKF